MIKNSSYIKKLILQNNEISIAFYYKLEKESVSDQASDIWLKVNVSFKILSSMLLDESL